MYISERTKCVDFVRTHTKTQQTGRQRDRQTDTDRETEINTERRYLQTDRETE